jgi:hypothetical protein
MCEGEYAGGKCFWERCEVLLELPRGIGWSEMVVGRRQKRYGVGVGVVVRKGRRSSEESVLRCGGSCLSLGSGRRLRKAKSKMTTSHYTVNVESLKGGCLERHR